jgi:hypothetical protein
VDVVTGGELPDGHAAGGVVADDAEQPCLAFCLGFRRRRGRQVAAAGGSEAGEGEGGYVRVFWDLDTNKATKASAVRVLPLTAASRRSLIDPVAKRGPTAVRAHNPACRGQASRNAHADRFQLASGDRPAGPATRGKCGKHEAGVANDRARASQWLPSRRSLPSRHLTER